MPNQDKDEKGEQRRRLILDAARQCFLNFGYEKTSLDDIAKRAGLSRPLIYLKFQGKKEIFAAVAADIIERGYPASEKALKAPGGARARLMLLYEALLIEPWKLFQGAPMAAELYDACIRIYSEGEEAQKHKRRKLKYTQEILGSRELTEVFMLALDGIVVDLPPTNVLKKRLAILIERFTD